MAAYTELNRATVTREMKKLVDLGILERVERDKWHLKDFEHGEQVPAAIMLRELLQNYMAITNKLEDLLPEQVLPVMRQSLADLGPIEVTALLDEDVERKMKRGLEVKH